MVYGLNKTLQHRCRNSMSKRMLILRDDGKSRLGRRQAHNMISRGPPRSGTCQYEHGKKDASNFRIPKCFQEL